VLASTWVYRAFGLCLASNRQISGLLPSEQASERGVDLRITFECIPCWLADYLDAPQTLRYVSPYLDDNGEPGLIVWLLAEGAFYRFHYVEDIDYVLSRDGTRLWIRASKTVAEKDVLSYLLGPIMGFILRVRGVVCLHASAVAVNRRAIVFVGDVAAGKSTTAMAMGRLGYAILSDDIVPIYEKDGITYAQPSYPRVRLRQTSLPMLSNLNSELPPLPKVVGEGRLHFDLTSGGYQFQCAPLPIESVYLLADGNVDVHAPRVESISPLEGIMGIVGNTYVTRFLDRSMRAQELLELSHLVNRVALRKVHNHCEATDLAMLCEVILEDVGALSHS
jgi:hypothetical protein